MAGTPQDSRAQLNEVIRLCQGGAFHEAEHVCLSLVKSNPRLADAWNLLATILHQLEDHEQSLSAAKQALKLRSDIPPYWLTRGNAELALGQFSSAADSLSRAARLAPAFAEAHMRLGVCRAAQGRTKDAITSYSEALRLAPDVAEIPYRLGQILKRDLQWSSAAQFFQAAFIRDPQFVLDREPGIDCLRHLTPDSIPLFWRAELLHFLQRTDISISRFVGIVVRVLKALPPLNAVLAQFESPDGLGGLPAPLLREVMGDALFQLLLCNDVVDDLALENLLMHLRSRILLDPEFRANLPPGFACALAAQCFNNEYVYPEGPEETAVIDALLAEIHAQRAVANTPLDVTTISLLAMYRPIDDLPGVEGAASNTTDPAWSFLFKKVVTNVLVERAERARIGSLGPINDETSLAVRQMYEENPYPRWFSLDRFVPVSLADWIANPVSITATHVPPGDPVRVLVAGCGTGKEACELALDIANAQVLAVDLSLSSLAFAKRTARELGINNIEFRQADLLNLGVAEESFDLVSSSGVLHHMRRPELGLAALVRQVRPGGLLRVALYSERARAAVRLARTHVKESGIRTDPAGIRAFRQYLRNLPDHEPLKRLTRWSDFYSLSTCRDLIFHVMEHQYRLPQIDSMLRDAGLVPVDFAQGLELEVVAEYKRRFPDDPAMTSVQNWDRFEEAFPNTFARMFTIRARKPERTSTSSPSTN